MQVIESNRVPEILSASETLSRTPRNGEVNGLTGQGQSLDEHLSEIIVERKGVDIPVGPDRLSGDIDSRGIHRDSTAEAHAVVSDELEAPIGFDLGDEWIGRQTAAEVDPAVLGVVEDRVVGHREIVREGVPGDVRVAGGIDRDGLCLIVLDSIERARDREPRIDDQPMAPVIAGEGKRGAVPARQLVCARNLYPEVFLDRV